MKDKIWVGEERNYLETRWMTFSYLKVCKVTHLEEEVSLVQEDKQGRSMGDGGNTP